MTSFATVCHSDSALKTMGIMQVWTYERGMPATYQKWEQGKIKQCPLPRTGEYHRIK
jgi:hypothetical protein